MDDHFGPKNHKMWKDQPSSTKGMTTTTCQLSQAQAWVQVCLVNIVHVRDHCGFDFESTGIHRAFTRSDRTLRSGLLALPIGARTHHRPDPSRARRTRSPRRARAKKTTRHAEVRYGRSLSGCRGFKFPLAKVVG